MSANSDFSDLTTTPSSHPDSPPAVDAMVPGAPALPLEQSAPNSPVPENQDLPVADEHDWNHVDPRMQTFWRIQAAIPLTITLVVCLGLVMLGHFKGWPILRAVAGSAGVGGLALLGFYPCWWARKLYATTGYRMGADVFERRQGVFWRETLAIPLNRLQHVDLIQSPWDRWLGLATLSLYTAGSQKAVHVVSGLPAEQAQTLRATLLTKVSDHVLRP